MTEHLKSSSGDEPPRWNFVTNHGRVLACITADPNARLRDIAEAAGITERTAAQIVSELGGAGYLTKTRVGRRNRYRVDGERTVHTGPLETMTVAQVLAVLVQALTQQPFS